ncbi:MAG: hypothetical protein HY649_07225 [Acidobacteria bacterium]|nr:hypothetical protein [Acidobacteriota bacterium]
MAHCPECEALMDIEEDELEEGQEVICPECGVELEVINANPLQLRLMEEEEEELEDEDEDLLDEEEEEEAGE